MYREIIHKKKTKSLVAFLATMIAFPLLAYGHDGFTTAHALSTWATKIGGPGPEDMFRGIERSSDGKYIFVGETDSFGAGSNDAWLVKLDQDGKVAWQKAYGGKSGDTARVIRQTPDGGFVVAGQTHSFGSGSSDFWLLKFDSNDNLEWQKAYGGPRSDIAHALELTSDEGYLLAGFTTSFGAVSKDYFVIKLNKDGAIEWQKRYGASAEDVIRFAKQTSDGEYLVAGFTHSFGGGGDIMILRLDSSGNVEWQKRYSGNGFDELSAAKQTPDGGFVVVGETKSFGLTSEDFWVLKFDSSAHLEWQRRYGGQGTDEAEAITLTPDGGYVIAGITYSFNSAGRDIWIIKLDSNGDVSQCDSEVHAGIVTSAAIRDTSAEPIETDLTIANTTAGVKNTNASVEDTDANISFQCSPTITNSPPQADDDSYSTQANQDLIVDAPGVLENDDDDDGDTLEAFLVSGPSHGALVLNEDGSFQYAPEEDYVGPDSFTYEARDGTDESGPAVVSLTVNSSNEPPVADDLDLSTEKNQPIEISLTGTDEDGPDALTFYITTLPKDGALSDANPGDIRTLTYTPANDFVGTDTFSFVIHDTEGAQSNIGTVSIEVTETTPPPGE